MKNLILLCSLLISSTYFSQVGIGISKPRGILDLSNTQDHEYGLVLPSSDDPTNKITNPQGGDVIPGTIVYDNHDDCIKYFSSKEEKGWSNCIKPTLHEDPLPIAKNVNFAYWGTNNYAIGGTGMVNFNSQLKDNENYGSKGTFKGVSRFIFTNITNDLTNLSSDDLIERFDIISTSYNQMLKPDAEKIKSYVDKGGVAIILLDQSSGTNIFQAFGGIGKVKTAGPSKFTTSNIPENEGVFGNARNVTLIGAGTFGNISSSQLPEDAKILAINSNSQVGVWTTGTEGRAIFFWDEGAFRTTDVTEIIDTPQEVFLHNIIAYALEKAGFTA